MTADGLAPLEQARPDISIIIVSYNTRNVLRDCLASVYASQGQLKVEIVVVDNASSDLSAEMVEAEFPAVIVLRSTINLGFGGANNLGLQSTRGRYIVLLNSDAFLSEESLQRSFSNMERDRHVGLGGGRLVGRDGSPQPSARMFPKLLTHMLVMSGLASRFPQSKFFGQADRTWADPMVASEVDWVPGAYSIICSDVLDAIGFFDPRFFLYYEEVDLCLRIQNAGFSIMYWPEIEVVHLGGESSKQVKTLELSQSGAQLVLWRMRSTVLFYRKHLGSTACVVMMFECFWYSLRALRNRLREGEAARLEVQNQRRLVRLMLQAWRETNGGRTSPAQPW